MTTTYIITFYAVIGILILASFLAGYLFSRQKFPQIKSKNARNRYKH